MNSLTTAVAKIGDVTAKLGEIKSVIPDYTVELAAIAQTLTMALNSTDSPLYSALVEGLSTVIVKMDSAIITELQNLRQATLAAAVLRNIGLNKTPNSSTTPHSQHPPEQVQEQTIPVT